MVNNSPAAQTVSATSIRAKQSFLKRRKFLIGGAIVVLAIAFLIYSSLEGATVYYMTPTEVQSKAETLLGQAIRMGGNVVEGPVNYDSKTMTLAFDMTDNNTTIPVLYKGVVPDAFKPGVEVVVEGKYTPGGTFEATSLLAKCPSKYVPGT